jgi:hypothetical protein
MSFFSRLRDIAKDVVLGRRQREATERFEEARKKGIDTGGVPAQTQRVEIAPEIIEDIDIPIYEVEEETVSTREYVPGPDPAKLRSGDLLSTAAFYGVTDEEYEHLAQLIDTAYVDPAASEWERRAAIREIQDAMSTLHNRARETGDFDWAAWREEHYPRAR